MTTTEAVKRSSGSDSKKSHKKSKNTASAESANVNSVEVANEGLRLMRYTKSESVLGQALLVDDDHLLPESNGSLEILKAESASARHANRLEFRAQTERLSVLCRNYGPGGAQTWPFKYAVALVPADGSPVRVWDAQVLVSERKVVGSDAINVADTVRLGANVGDSAASLQMNYREAQNLLGESFGTRKRKQAIASAEKNKIRVDGMDQNKTTSIITTNMSVPVAVESANSDASTALLPPFNKETKDAAEIYLVKDLIPREAFKSLPVADIPSLSDAELMTRFGLSEGWCHRIRSVLAKKSTSGTQDLGLRLCLFAAYLAAFRELREAAINGPNGSVAAVQAALGCPAEVAADFLARFADALPVPEHVSSITARQRHKMAPTLRDKATLYVLALLLHLDNFRVNLTATAGLLNLTPIKLTGFFRALGCTIDKPARGDASGKVQIGERMLTVKYARLTAPLTFPAPPKRQQK